MISREQGLYAILNEAFSIRLFQLHRYEIAKLRSLARTRIRRREWQQVSLFPSRKMLAQQGFHKPSASYSENSSPTSTTIFQITVTSNDGHHKGCFYGTRSQVYSQVGLFLMTGKSGLISPEKLSRGSARRVWSSLSSEMSREGTRVEFPLREAELSRHRTRHHEATNSGSTHSPA